MIRLKLMRVKSSGIGSPGSTTITAKDAEMIFFPELEFAAVKRHNKTRDEYIVPTADISYMQPLEPMEYFLTDDALWKGPSAQEETKPAPPVPEQPKVDDTVRMVKINGRIVERKGPPQDDELEALTSPAPARGIFAETDEEQ